jgi:hypothetical protein
MAVVIHGLSGKLNLKKLVNGVKVFQKCLLLIPSLHVQTPVFNKKFILCQF